MPKWNWKLNIETNNPRWNIEMTLSGVAEADNEDEAGEIAFENANDAIRELRRQFDEDITTLDFEVLLMPIVAVREEEEKEEE